MKLTPGFYSAVLQERKREKCKKMKRRQEEDEKSFQLQKLIHEEKFIWSLTKGLFCQTFNGGDSCYSFVS